MSAAKHLVVMSDDFGMCPPVNEGIVQAFTEGLLTDTNLRPPCPSFSEAASLAFDQAAWSVAIERYQEVLDHLRSLGYAQGDDLLSQTLYDQAMAYWNDEQYANAERLLGSIRTANPDYDVARIEDQHQQVIAILREQ